MWESLSRKELAKRMNLRAAARKLLDTMTLGKMLHRCLLPYLLLPPTQVLLPPTQVLYSCEASPNHEHLDMHVMLDLQSWRSDQIRSVGRASIYASHDVVVCQTIGKYLTQTSSKLQQLLQVIVIISA